MAQVDRRDDELVGLLRGYLQRLERALERTLRRARDDGTLRAEVSPRDAARNLVALTQGMALMGRVSGSSAGPRSMVRAALEALRS
jgi:hypothetical protein